VGDTVAPSPDENVPVLAYGKSRKFGTKMTCTSRRTGLTCRNTRDHGFFLSRERIRVF
jgi:hypothetical protein